VAGSAASVAAGLCAASVAVIRVLDPDSVSHVRIVGLKPTYGRVSVYGVVPLSPSFDHVGPIARSVTDAAISARCLAGH